MEQHMRETFAEQTKAEGAETYLAPDTSAEAMASFFSAAADLFRSKPWDNFPKDAGPIAVSIEELGVERAAIFIVGARGEDCGVLGFADVDDFEEYVDAVPAIDAGEEPTLPPHWMLQFERGAELPPAIRKEIVRHGWEVAGADAYPSLIILDSDLMGRPPVLSELVLAEALCRALPSLVRQRKALKAAWSGGAPVRHELRVATHAGVLSVTLEVPCEPPPTMAPDNTVLGALAAMARSDDEMDYDERRRLEGELSRQFAESPEGAEFKGFDYAVLICDFAANYFDTTLAALRPSELREIVFGLFPRKVLIPPSEASAVIEEARALYRFLDREYRMPQAKACLRTLSGPAAQRLEALMGDTRSFGMAKSLVSMGRDAGFDVDSKDGLEAWLQHAASVPTPAASPATPKPKKRSAPAKTRPAKSKAASKARRKLD
jgi:hypothetical protein